MEITQEAIEIIKAEETLQLEAYQDGESISIGYGHSNTSGGEQFELGDTITEEKAEELLAEDLKEIQRIVNQRMENYGVTLTQGQYDAMVVGTYNRPEQLKSKKIYTTLASGDMDAITEAWNKTVSEEDKEKYPGLIKRIESELGLMEEVEKVIPDDGDPDRGIPEPVPGYKPVTVPPMPRTPYIPPSQMTQYTSQVPLAAQDKTYGRVRQMLEAQVNKQKKQAGHTPYIPGVPPQVTFSDAVQAALKLLGR
jgi:GH24 family phage-related lysozyme (muramidase)